MDERAQGMSRSDRQAAYLRALQEKNRHKKLSHAKTREEQLNEERERGFQLNWAGANEQRGNKDQEGKDRRKSGGFSFFRSGGAQSTAAASDASAGGDSAVPRRQWDAPVQFIQGMNGPIRAYRPGFGDMEPDFDGNETIQTREQEHDQDFDDEHEHQHEHELEASSQVVEFLQSIGSSAEMDALRRSLECTLSPSKHRSDGSNSQMSNSDGNGVEALDGSERVATSDLGGMAEHEAAALPLAPTLVDQIQNLTVDQQLELFRLLQQITAAPPASNVATTRSDAHERQQQEPTEGGNSNGDSKRQRQQQLQPLAEPNLRSLVESPAVGAANLGELSVAAATAPSSAAEHVVKVRIRMTSTWEGGRLGSLSRVQFYVLANGKKHPLPLGRCNPRVQSGLEVLGSNADETRLLDNLLQATRTRREVWKGPVARSSPLQILVDIPVLTIQQAIPDFQDDTRFVVAVDIWNADDGHAALAVRDVDVFSNSRCCWSGELPRRTPSDRPHSVVLIPEPDNTDARQESQQPLSTEIAEAATPQPAPEKAQESRTENDAALSWMDDINQMPRKPPSTLETEVAIERPPSGRTRSRRQKAKEMAAATGPAAVTPAVAVVATTNPKDVQPKPPLVGSLSVSIPPAPAGGSVSGSSALGSPLSKFVASSEDSDSQKKNTVVGSEWGVRPSRSQAAAASASNQSSTKGEDERLRSSLEALRKSDRQPRGRLAALGISFFSRGKEPAREQAASAEEQAQQGNPQQSALDEGVNEINATPAEPAAVAAAAATEAQVVEPTQQPAEEAAAPAHSKKEVLETRARKIGKVKRDVENALAGLVGVIGQFNQKKERTEQPSSPEANSQADNEDGKRVEAADVLEASTVTIPELPAGRVFRMEILSTWGDPFYVGLNGFEIFDQHGQLIRLDDRSKQIFAQPADINVLPEYDGDPRVKENLFDGVNYTCDDLHMWLAPYNAGEKHFVMVDFRQPVTLSMIRVWNYNKSRTHAYRGVRVVRLSLDDRVIFEGEILMASGVLDGVENCSEVILFTLDSDVMKTIAKFDEQQEYLSEDRTTHWTGAAFTALNTTRPATAAAVDHGATKPESASARMWKRKARADRPRMTYEEAVSGKAPMHRPLTAARTAPGFRDKTDFASLGPLPDTIDELLSREPSPERRSVPGSASPPLNDQEQYSVTTCSTVELLIHATWGDVDYVGLTGIQVIGANGDVISLRADQITTTPKDLSAIGVRNDPRVSANLVDNINDTTDDTHMWLAPFNQGEDHVVRIRLSKPTEVAGLRIWNYNKSPEDSYRGAKDAEIRLDGRTVGASVLRIAPGMDGLSLGQLVLFDEMNTPSPVVERARSYVSPSVRQDYETQLLPSGLLWQFIFHSTWGDPYYLGLDGLELYDGTGAKIAVDPIQLSALPHSVRDINQTDSRVPANLVDGTAPWLAPLANSMTPEEHKACVVRCGQEYAAMTNSIAPPVHERLTTPAENMLFIALNRPEPLSFVRIFNYSKTPERGVKEISIRCDGKLVYRGTVNKANVGEQPRRGQTILFTNDPRIVQKEKDCVAYCGRTEQDVLCIDDGKVKVRSQAMHAKPDPTAPGVQTDLTMRPDTALR